MDARNYSEIDGDNDKGFDWSTMAGVVERHGRDPVNGHSSALFNQLMAKLSELEGAVYPVNISFKWKGRTKTVNLKFKSEVTAPRRDEPIVVSFLDDDDGKKYRVSSEADYTIHHYVDARTMNSVSRDGLILEIWLKPVTIQPVQEELAKAYAEEYAGVPTFSDYERDALSKAVKGATSA